MADIDHARLFYLILLGGALVSWFLSANRESRSRTVQKALSWVLIFLGVIAAVGLWDDIRSTVAPQQAVFEDAGRIEIPRGRDGHYHLTLKVNGTPVRFIVDTGASNVVLSKRDATRIGLAPDTLPYIGRAITANGEVRTAPVMLDEVSLGAIRDRRVAATVNEAPLEQSLLGMSYLQRFSEITISGNRLILTR